uniref:RING-type domain-containing protein n=1 Tax=Astatotilapia calliptera TaxID=8154 RepID=A0AAX7VR21_ASTCA
MASKLQEDLSCPVCKDIFKDPVILSCKHSFCNDCLQKYWANKNDLGCPVCKRKSSKECPPVYFELKKRCEAFLQERLLLCRYCTDQEAHRNHRFQSVDEASQDHKKKLEDSLKPLKKKMRAIREVKGKCDQTAELVALREEEEQKKNELRAGNVSFLQNYSAAVERVQQQPLPDDAELASGAQVDVAQHVAPCNADTTSTVRRGYRRHTPLPAGPWRGDS